MSDRINNTQLIGECSVEGKCCEQWRAAVRLEELSSPVFFACARTMGAIEFLFSSSTSEVELPQGAFLMEFVEDEMRRTHVLLILVLIVRRSRLSTRSPCRLYAYLDSQLQGPGETGPY